MCMIMWDIIQIQSKTLYFRRDKKFLEKKREKIHIYSYRGAYFNKKSINIFLFLHENICCGYSLKAPNVGTSTEYPQYMFSWRNKKNICLEFYPVIYEYIVYQYIAGFKISLSKAILLLWTA